MKPILEKLQRAVEAELLGSLRCVECCAVFTEFELESEALLCPSCGGRVEDYSRNEVKHNMAQGGWKPVAKIDALSSLKDAIPTPLPQRIELVTTVYISTTPLQWYFAALTAYLGVLIGKYVGAVGVGILAGLGFWLGEKSR